MEISWKKKLKLHGQYVKFLENQGYKYKFEIEGECMLITLKLISLVCPWIRFPYNVFILVHVNI